MASSVRFGKCSSIFRVCGVATKRCRHRPRSHYDHCNKMDEAQSLEAKLGEMLSVVVCDYCHVLKDEKKFEGEVVSL